MSEIYDLAARYESRFAATFLSEVARVRGQITDGLVAQVMSRGLADEPRAIYQLIDGIRIAKAATEEDVYAKLIAGAGQMELRLNGHRMTAQAFKVTSPLVLEAARKHAANLVAEVSRETKRSVRQVIFEAIRDGNPPAKAAQMIRQIVGLTKSHAIAVKRFAENHSERGTARYARKLLNLRARTIARTETIRASRAGQQTAWQQMVRDRLIDTRRFRQVWLVTDDERTCSRCAPMQGKQASLGSQFSETERGVLPSQREPVVGETVDGPPLHPSCRCVLVAEFG